MAALLATPQAALLLPPCLGSACERWIFSVNELPLLQPVLLEGLPR